MKKTNDKIKEARKFIRKNPDKEQYVADNFKNFWNYTFDEPDDDSIIISDEWDEMFELSGYKTQNAKKRK